MRAAEEDRVALEDGAREFPVPYDAFATTLRSRTVNDGRNRRMVPGHPDEVFLKLLKIRHGREKHTPAQWWALIERLKAEPAHPMHPGFASRAGA